MTNKTLKSKNNNIPEFNSHLKNYQIKSKTIDDINGLRMHYLECGDKKIQLFYFCMDFQNFHSAGEK